MKWIRGADPTLIVYAGDVEEARIQLSPYDYAGLHKLFSNYFGQPIRRLEQANATAAQGTQLYDASAPHSPGRTLADRMGPIVAANMGYAVVFVALVVAALALLAVRTSRKPSPNEQAVGVLHYA